MLGDAARYAPRNVACCVGSHDRYSNHEIPRNQHRRPLLNETMWDGVPVEGRVLIYGSYGYTGDLIARRAVERGLRPVLAGRNEEALARQAAELNLEYRAFSLDDERPARTALAECAVVMHCAGPFSKTSQSMVAHCLAVGTHYLDITGEIAVFESLAAQDKAARAADVMLLGGVGFDVVPTDCLAAHLKRRLPGATSLALGFQTVGSGLPSRGTQRTMVEGAHHGGLVRRDGRLTPVPSAWKTRTIDFGMGPQRASTIPWGDVSTAFYSTGIPNIEVYMAVPRALQLAMRASRHLKPVLHSSRVQQLLVRGIDRQRPGPNAEQRARGASLVWGMATDDEGRSVTSRLRTPESYVLTALTAVTAIEHVLAGDAKPGFQTPSLAFGADFILEIDGVTRRDD